MSEKTLFSKIIDREIPARFEHEDDHCVAIHDIHAQAPVHLLIIPKRELVRLSEAVGDDGPLLGHLMLVAARLAGKLQLADGFRLVVNNGRHAGEEIPHLHIHLLAGRPMSWPPG